MIFRWIKSYLAIFILILTVPGVAGCGNTTQQSSTNKPYAGTTLRVVLANHPWTDAIKPLIPQFEQQTGMTIKTEAYGETQLTQKLTVEFVAGNSDIDVFMQRPLQEARQYVKNGWYTDLNTYVKDTSKTPGSWNYKDFESRAIGTEQVNGTLTGIPIVVEHEVLYYRKDLLQQAGIAVPQTLDQLKQAAAKLTVPGKQQYGFVARGQQAAAVTQFSSFLYSYGGDWFNQNSHTATLNSPQAISALTLYGNLLHDYGPPGVLNMSWPQASAIFGQGKAAMYTDADSIYTNLLDPSKSQFANQTGVASFPAGPGGFTPYSVCSWGLSMSANAPHKDAAWEFIKWATSPAITLQIQGTKSVPEARTSVYNDPNGIAKFPKDWLTAARASAAGRQYDRPLVVQVGKARDIIGSAIVAAIEGKDVSAAVQQANSQFQALIDSETKH
ncbi:MAG: ABC transporter substrate-binding protein [Ktedonobacteraceae bacterium]